LAKQEQLKNKNIVILHNAIENYFLENAAVHRKETPNFQNVLMVCSLKTYKGVNEFVALSQLHQQYQFRLVVNAKQEDIDKFFKSTLLPLNLEIFPTQTNLHPFYSWADTVLNLSHPDAWIETFGLTIIEAMAYGLPVIVPPVGGITELVIEGENGFMVNSKNTKDLSMKLKMILENHNLYTQMRRCALKEIDSFSENVFAKKSLKILNSQKNEFINHPNKLKSYAND
jgi:glycosyltransferase involved in cell wall biosynthesis